MVTGRWLAGALLLIAIAAYVRITLYLGEPIGFALGWFAIASAIALYAGVQACGSWNDVPWLEMLEPQNHRYFGGTGALVRHGLNIALWTISVAAYSCVLAHLVKLTSVELLQQWWGGRAFLSGLSAFTLCRLTRHTALRDERRETNRLLLEENLPRPTQMISQRELWPLRYAPINASVRVMMWCLHPFYRELLRRKSVVAIGAHALLIKHFSYDQLVRVANRCDRRAVRNIKNHLSEVSEGKQVEMIVSVLYTLYGYYTACDMVIAVNANANDDVIERKRDTEPWPTVGKERRLRPRTSLDGVTINAFIVCKMHGDHRAALKDRSAGGLGVVARVCDCVREDASVDIVVNGMRQEALVRYRKQHGATEEALIGLALAKSLA